ncbi:hypothetical protein [Methylocapsa palsarum]|nr:hypothetical protein [Methylocapsa palsarum]
MRSAARARALNRISFDDASASLSDVEVDELAARLASVRNNAEFDHLLGAILTHAAARSGGALSAPLGRALGGLLKSIARQGLSREKTAAALGLELDGLRAADREYEAARRFVRLAGEASRHAAESALHLPSGLAAKAALAAAADIYAPPMLSTSALFGACTSENRREGGVRQGRMRRDLLWSPELEVAELWVDPFDYDPEMEYFLGGLIRSAGRAVKGAVRAVGKIGPIRDIARAAGSIANTVSKAADAIGKIPILGDVARAGVGGLRLALGPTAIAIDAGSRLARGQSIGDALKGAVKGQIDAVRDQLKVAEMVAPFIPGVGTGVAAALGAANALAAGRPITEAVLAAARGAVPGGRIAQAAFDVAMNLAKGRNIGEAALAAARDQLPGGPAARAAFDGAVALAQGKRLQDAAFTAAGRILPPSPYAADALDFVRRVSNGQNVQNAALSVAGQRILRQVRANSVVAAALPGAVRSLPAGGAAWRSLQRLPNRRLAGRIPSRTLYRPDAMRRRA